MGILQDVFDALKAFEIAKIDGQPMDDDINKLMTQLTAALVTISTTNGGGTLGHIGFVVPQSRYVALSMGPRLVRPVHPGAYPATTSDDMKICEKLPSTKQKSKNLKLTWHVRHGPAWPS
jgi:hypothetical protein